MNKRCFIITLAALSASIMGTVQAQPEAMTIDFDDGVNPFTDGTISTDQSVSGSNSLYLGVGDFGTFDIPAEYDGQNLVITMQVYDQGLWIDREVPGFPPSSYGARWGVGNDPAEATTYLAGAITERTFGSGAFLSSTGYSTHPATGQAFNAAPWFTVYGYSGSAAIRADALGDGGSTDGGFWVPPQPGPGMWTEWTFTVLANGDATFSMTGLPLVADAGGPLYNLGGATTGIYLFGGSTNADGFGSLSGVYVDNITIDIAADDILPPTVPQSLVFSNVTDTSVDLDWEASTDDNEVLGYNVYTNGSNPVNVTETSVSVIGLTPGETYTFTVTAYDSGGNDSAPSAGVEVTTTGSVGMTINFDDGTNPFSSGAVSTDYAASGDNSLYLGNRETATFALPEEFQNKDVIVTLEVLDLGLWIDNAVEGHPANAYGPRWGVGNATTAANFVAFTIIHKTFLGSNGGYGVHRVSSGDDFGTTSWFSPAFYSGTTRAALSADGGSNPGTGWVPGTVADEPVWTKWSFMVSASGDATFNIIGGNELTGDNLGGAASTILLYGGNDGSSSQNALTGLYVDNITISAAPGDEEPPTVPEGLAASNITESSVDLAWDAASDNVGVTGYFVYINGENPVSVTETSATVSDLNPGTNYTFTVSAFDGAGNESDQSEGVQAKTKLPIGLAIDFDGGENPFSSGAISTDYAFNGENSLYLGNRETATFSLPEEFQNADVIITMQVLDLGLWIDNDVEGHPANAYGPRWGVGNATTAANYVAGTIIHKTFLPSNAGYGLHQVNAGGDFSDTSWFSPSFMGGSSRFVLSDDGGSNPGTGWVPGTVAAEPVWMEWTFVVSAEGDVVFNVNGMWENSSNNIGGPASAIYLYGGNDGSSSQNALTGLYVDQVTLTVDPGDIVPPSTVTGLTVSNLTDTSLELSWDPATDDVGVVGYQVISDPDLGEIIVTETGVILTDLDPDTEYTFTVVALDEAGNASEASDPLVVTTKITVPPYDGPEYYVDPANGSMEYNGSEELPWSTLQAVFEAGKTFEPGDTIYLLSGLHGIPVIDGANEDYVYIMPDEGAEPQLIRLRFADTSSYWDVSGLEISPSFAEFYVRDTMVGISGSHNILSDSLIYSVPDISGWGLLEWTSRSPGGVSIGGEYTLLENSTIMNVYHGLSVGESAVHSVIRGNHIQNFGGDGIRGLADDAVYEYNYIADCYNIDDNHDDGFQSWSNGPGGVGTETVFRVTLRGNMIVQQTDPERTELIGPLQGVGCFDGMYEDWVIENNVVITNHSHGIALYGPVNCRFVNNTVIDIDGNMGRPWLLLNNHKDGTSPSGNLVRNNLVTILITSDDATATVDNNRVVSPTEYDTFFVGHPFDLRLTDGSPAIDAGTNRGAPAMDIDGNARPFDGNWDGFAVTDWGAYEKVGGEWVNHYEMGWIYVGYVVDTSNMWIYSLYLNGWMWSSDSLFPIVYDWNNNRWIYFFMVEDIGVWLFDYSTFEWVLNP